MRNLVVCCDGTWNTQDQRDNGVPVPTNVVKTYHCLADLDGAGNKQLAYYHPGVGTNPSLVDKVVGGGVGGGLDKNVKSAYRWVCDHFQPGDKLFLFGFSRGAYTARSLGGLLTACGILKLDGLSESESWARVDKGYDSYYRVEKGKRDPNWSNGWPFVQSADDVRIDFIGVWDTVGALGVPDNMAVLNLLDDLKSNAFHDTELNSKVLCARHAVALDEKRASFTPTLWVNVAGRDVKQIWFPGVHCDVGGGYAQTGLSDGALKWMLDEAAAKGLVLDARKVAQIRPDAQDVLHDSLTSVFKLMRTQPRSVPSMDDKAALHASALARHDNPPITEKSYRKTFSLQPGESQVLSIYANQHWNDTGLYLEEGGQYKFAANGEWLDGSIACGPKGTADGKFSPWELVHLAASAWGKVEGAWKSLTSNKQADFKFTRREESMPWFVLVGAVANGGNPREDGTPEPHETFVIGDGCLHKVRKSGYLFCYANDVWDCYENNRGSVTLKVERTG